MAAEEQGKFRTYITLACDVIRQFNMAVFSLSVHSYFLWSALFFAGCGLALTVGKPRVDSFLCSMPPPGSCTACRDELLVCPKSECYRHAINITWQRDASDATGSLYQAFMQAATDTTCNDLVKTYALEPVGMIKAISDGTAGTVTEGCSSFHCGVLQTALGGSTDLDSASGICTNTFGAKPAAQATACPCTSLLSAITPAEATAIQSICGTLLQSRCPWGSFTGSWCDTTTTQPVTSTVTTVAGASVRRLAEETLESVPAPEPSWVAPKQRHSHHGCADAHTNSSFARQLQGTSPTPSAAVELNNALEDWTVGAWSQCTCYQQCIPGVKTRLVECLAARCKEPQPASSERCVCKHCASCSVVFRMFVLSILFFSQAGVTFIVYLSYLHATTVKEESLIKVSLSRKLIGMVCKNLPSLVQILVLANACFTGLILTQTFVPGILGLEWMKDCFKSSELRLVALIVAGLVVFQLILGRCAKQLTRKPPWLISPDRANWPTPLKQLRHLFRAFGP